LLLAGGHLPLAGVSLGIRLLQKHGWVNVKDFFKALLILPAAGKQKDPPAGELVTGRGIFCCCVRKGGLEPPRPKAQEPKSCVSANFTTRAWLPLPGVQLPG
jgi:hypothetical protein